MLLKTSWFVCSLIVAKVQCTAKTQTDLPISFLILASQFRRTKGSRTAISSTPWPPNCAAVPMLTPGSWVRQVATDSSTPLYQPTDALPFGRPGECTVFFLQAGVLTGLPFPDNTFDVVYCSHVLLQNAPPGSDNADSVTPSLFQATTSFDADNGAARVFTAVSSVLLGGGQGPARAG